jgi:hypothetical protein
VLEVQLLDKLGQRQLPGFLLRVGKAAELLGIQPQLSGHLDVGIRKMVALARIDPALIFIGYLALCQQTSTFWISDLWGEYAMPVISRQTPGCRWPNGCRFGKNFHSSFHALESPLQDRIHDVRPRFQMIQIPVGVVFLNRFVHPAQDGSNLGRIVAWVSDDRVDRMTAIPTSE